MQAEVAAIWESRWVTNGGPKHQALEAALSKRLGGAYLSLHNNGTMALLAGLAGLGMPRGAEVVTTPFTFPATVDVLHALGLVPVFADIDRETFNLDPDAVDAAVTDRTVSILGLHAYGTVADVDALGRIGVRHGIPVVFDAAPCFGATFRGRPVETYGDGAMVSLHATKVYSTVEGGVWVTRHADVHAAVQRFRNFGMTPGHPPEGPGLNTKLDELKAAFGLLTLPAVGAEIAARSERSARWRAGLAGRDGLLFQAFSVEFESNHAYMPVLFDASRCGLSRAEAIARLHALNVHPRPYYSPLCSAIPPFDAHPSASGLDNACWVTERVLCLPMYGDLPLDVIDACCRALTAP